MRPRPADAATGLGEHDPRTLVRPEARSASAGRRRVALVLLSGC
jgi:hypothetical protein